MTPGRRGDPPGWPLTFAALALVATSAGFLAAAFHFPFVESRFALVLPDWIPDVMDSHDRIRAWLIQQGRIPVGEQRLTQVVAELSRDGEWFIAAAIVVFSFLFPVGKIVGSGVVLTLARRRARTRRLGLRLLELTSKWSMADVFIVGVVIVFFKAEGFHFEIEARTGLYCFAASAVTSALAVTFTRWLFTAPTNDLVSELDEGRSRLADLPPALAERPEIERLSRDLDALRRHLRE